MRLGPIAGVTLVAPNLDQAIAAYVQALGLKLHEQTRLPEHEALRLGAPLHKLARVAHLGTQDRPEPWLRIIEDTTQVPVAAFMHTGWIALEVLVEDVDALASELGNHFRVLRPPADLDLGDAIRAMQVQGPAGEVLYLTQIKRPVPPFQLPSSQGKVGMAFVTVLAARSLSESLGFYGGLGGIARYRFETRLSALNQAQNLPLESRHAVGVWQLRGNHLIEIDQATECMGARHKPDGRLPSGLAHIAFWRSQEIGTRLDQSYHSATAHVTAGPDGESLELL
jgi:catechol 2,3-dioxygenase-like lactoylglutathione lyase family enzyme